MEQVLHIFQGPKQRKTYLLRFYFDGVMATEFDSEVTAIFKLNGEAIGQTLTYSVNSYVYYMQDNANETLSELVKAIYNYGRSAVAYGN